MEGLAPITVQPVRVDVAAGDTVAVAVDDVLTDNQRAHIEAHTLARLPAGVKVLVLDRRTGLQIRSSPAAHGRVAPEPVVLPPLDQEIRAFFATPAGAQITEISIPELLRALQYDGNDATAHAAATALARMRWTPQPRQAFERCRVWVKSRTAE